MLSVFPLLEPWYVGRAVSKWRNNSVCALKDFVDWRGEKEMQK